MIEVNPEGEKTTVDPARVSVNMGFTRNMGNFESMRIEIGIEASANQGEKVGEAFDRVYAFVEKKLVEKFAETEAELSQRGLGESD